MCGYRHVTVYAYTSIGPLGLAPPPLFDQSLRQCMLYQSMCNISLSVVVCMLYRSQRHSLRVISVSVSKSICRISFMICMLIFRFRKR